MLVSNANLSLSSAYSRTSTFSLSERLALSRVAESTVDLNPQEDTLTLSDEAKAVLALSGGNLDGVASESSLTPQATMLKSILEKALGVSIGDMDIEELALSMSSQVTDASQETTQLTSTSALYSYQQSHSESSQASLSMEGTIRTKDGQELAFDLDLSLGQSLATQTNVSAQVQVAEAQGAAQEQAPLQIDFDGVASDLRSMAFSFAAKADRAKGSGLLSVGWHGENDGRHLGHAKRADHERGTNELGKQELDVKA